MRLIKAEHDRLIAIEGVPNPVKQPVSIDKSQTGFATLRSLRIYRFEADSVVDGHAEEDEVFMVVLAGTVELTLIDSNPADIPRPIIVSAVGDSPGHPCAAYLPPHAAYQLVPRTRADVAYARATPAGGPPPRVFSSHADPHHDGIAVLLQAASYPRLLRVRLLQIRAGQHEIVIKPIEELGGPCEALIHVTSVPDERFAAVAETIQATIPVTSWDTVAVTVGEQPALRIAAGSSALVLIILANFTISIRVASISERPALEALQWRASLVAPDYRDALLADPDAISIPDDQLASERVLICEVAGVLAGFAVLLPREDGDAELDGLFVEPDRWRQGLGARLVREAATRAGAAGARHLQVVANPTALAFYTACGFEQTGQQATRFGPAILMRLAVK